MELTRRDPPVKEFLRACPPSKARRVPLSRERVLTAALRLVDTQGLDALMMRRLGQELGRDPMALYRHAKNRAAPLDAVADLVPGQLIIPTLVTDWQAQLCSIAHEFRRLALVHSNVVPLLVTRPLATPLGLRPLGTLRPLEQLLALLTTGGAGVDLCAGILSAGHRRRLRRVTGACRRWVSG